MLMINRSFGSKRREAQGTTLRFTVKTGAAHFGALDVLPDILRWLSGDQRAA